MFSLRCLLRQTCLSKEHGSTYHVVSERLRVCRFLARRHRLGNTLGPVPAGGPSPACSNKPIPPLSSTSSYSKPTPPKGSHDRTSGHRFSRLPQLRGHWNGTFCARCAPPRTAASARKTRPGAPSKTRCAATCARLSPPCSFRVNLPCRCPDPAVEKIRAIDNLARELRLRLQAN
jgi:hypothetical protein